MGGTMTTATPNPFSREYRRDPTEAELAAELEEIRRDGADIEERHRIRAELPGILKWSILGWERLHKRGRFLQHDSGQSIIDEMAALGSPIGTFVDERCERGPNLSVPTQDLFAAWKAWCDTMNIRPGSDAEFGQNLRAFDPSIVRTRPRNASGVQVPRYETIELKP
jgi:putative DNA primase/helicase